MVLTHAEILKALSNQEDYDKIIYSAPEGPDGDDEWTRYKYPVGRAAQSIEEFISFIKQTVNFK